MVRLARFEQDLRTCWLTLDIDGNTIHYLDEGAGRCCCCLLCLALCLVFLAVVTFKGKPLLGVVLVVAILRTSGAATVSLTGLSWATTATAWCGLLLALLAFYSAIAFLEEDVAQRLSPLTFRTGKAKSAMEGELKNQVSSIEKEAGGSEAAVRSANSVSHLHTIFRVEAELNFIRRICFAKL